MPFIYSDIAPILAELEKKFSSEIENLTIKGWSLWPIYRIEIGHSLLPSDPSTHPPESLGKKTDEKWRRRKLILRSFFQFLSLVLSRTTVGKVMTRTLTYNRRETYRDKKYCVFFDQLVMDLGRERFVVSEGRGFEDQRYETSVPNRVDFYDDVILRMARFFEPYAKWKLKRRLPHLRTLAENIDPRASKSIDGIALTFLSHYYAWKLIYRLFKPQAVLVSVAPYKREAEIAALRSLKIPVYEYQHGDMTSVDISYCYSSHVKHLKAIMPIPDKMFLFGTQQKDVLLESGFWTADQLEVTGSPQIYFSERVGIVGYPYDPTFRNILVTPSVLNGVPTALRDFIRHYIASTGAEKYRFYVRPHPSERYEDWVEFSKEFPGKVLVARANLHSQIKGAFAQLGVFTSCFHEGFHWNVPAYVLKAGPWEMALPLIEGGSARLILPDFSGEFEKFEVPAKERERFMTVDTKKLEKLLFESK